MIPPSLLGADLAPLWDAVRERLERRGSTSRGRLRTPELSLVGRHRLSSLLARPLTATVDLGDLERALMNVGGGNDLIAALGLLGHPMSFEREDRREGRRVARQARDTVRSEVSLWPERWAASWADEVIQVGLVRQLDVKGATSFVGSVRRCLDALEAADHPNSRVDLAALVLGDSHCLDVGTRLGAAMMCALRQRFATELHDDSDRTVWERAGVPSDSVSAPALTWNLPVKSGAFAPIIETATSLGVVVHLSQMALLCDPLVFREPARVLVTENPRVVEAAAQRRSPLSVVSTNGNPSTAVRLLLHQLLDAGADLRYHGDFDAAGIAICRRMFDFGLRPWRMSTEDYSDALSEANVVGVELPIDIADPGPTPWDEGLREVFRSSRKVVHEERVLDSLLVDTLG